MQRRTVGWTKQAFKTSSHFNRMTVAVLQSGALNPLTMKAMKALKPYKIPRSTLVVIHTTKLEVLLIERAEHGYWQSVTGSQDADETLAETAAREVMEETGIDAAGFQLTDWRQKNVYEIYPIWLHRYAPGTTHNTEHVFGLLLPDRVSVTLHAGEHLQYVWLPYDKAAPLCFSPTNRDAILELPQRVMQREPKIA